jgi:hypothetical protein
MFTKFEGIWVPIITPFLEGKVEHDGLAKLAKYLSAQGVSGVSLQRITLAMALQKRFNNLFDYGYGSGSTEGGAFFLWRNLPSTTEQIVITPTRVKRIAHADMNSSRRSTWARFASKGENNHATSAPAAIKNPWAISEVVRLWCLATTYR